MLDIRTLDTDTLGHISQPIADFVGSIRFETMGRRVWQEACMLGGYARAAVGLTRSTDPSTTLLVVGFEIAAGYLTMTPNHGDFIPNVVAATCLVAGYTVGGQNIAQHHAARHDGSEVLDADSRRYASLTDVRSQPFFGAPARPPMDNVFEITTGQRLTTAAIDKAA